MLPYGTTCRSIAQNVWIRFIRIVKNHENKLNFWSTKDEGLQSEQNLQPAYQQINGKPQHWWRHQGLPVITLYNPYWGSPHWTWDRRSRFKDLFVSKRPRSGPWSGSERCMLCCVPVHEIQSSSAIRVVCVRAVLSSRNTTLNPDWGSGFSESFFQCLCGEPHNHNRVNKVPKRNWSILCGYYIIFLDLYFRNSSCFHVSKWFTFAVKKVKMPCFLLVGFLLFLLPKTQTGTILEPLHNQGRAVNH